MKQSGMETEQVTQGRHSGAGNGTPSLLTTIAKVRSLQVVNVWETLVMGREPGASILQKTCKTGSYLPEGVIFLFSGRKEIWLSIDIYLWLISKCMLASRCPLYHKCLELQSPMSFPSATTNFSPSLQAL